jgi:S1-C subfamily serine protease
MTLMSRFLLRCVALAAPAAGLAACLAPLPAADPPPVDKAVADAERARIEVIKKVSPAVVAVCQPGGQALGSGVLIDPEGYALTNYHVTEAVGGPFMRCGLHDGVLYDTILVGIDPVGDTALIQLMPKEKGKPFPFVDINAGDSDRLKIGDWTFTMGNPHGLALDFTPSVAFGIVSGINRYLKIDPRSPMEYTDAIQVETAVNPGNSGGPLFDSEGRLVGINSAASIRRGGANAGLGIAISINQIKNFLGHLRAGMIADHATLGAIVKAADDGELSKLVIGQILDESDAYRRGLRTDDQLLMFAGRVMTSPNQYKNILGLLPKGWRVPVVYRHNNERRETLVRMMGALPTEKEQEQPMVPMPPTPPGPGGPRPRAKIEIPKDSEAAKRFKEKKGYANYHFNEVAQKQLLDAARRHGDFSTVPGPWVWEGTYKVGSRNGDVRLEIAEGKGQDGGPLVTLKLNTESRLDPYKDVVRDQLEPLGSGGLMMAMFHYRRFLTLGAKGFEGEFSHGGFEPLYPPPADGSTPKSLASLRVDCEVLRTKHGSIECKWYFSRKDQLLLGFETTVSREESPCEVYFSDYKAVEGRMLPHRMEVRWGDKKYGDFTFKTFSLK